MSSGQQTNIGWVQPGIEPLNDTLWQAWLAKGRARDTRKRAEFHAVVRCVSVAVLLVAAGVWSNLAAWDVMVRFIVAAGALAIMLQALRSADYAIAGVFGVVAVLYNPIAPVFSFAGEWQRGLVLGTALLFAVSFYWRSRMPLMREGQGGRTRRAVAAALLLSAVPAWVNASDLAMYRTFKFGTDTATVAKQIGIDPSRIKVVHARPALIQELEWRPGGLGPTTEPETVQNLVFSFYEGDLYQITASYDRRGTEGMTVDDFTEAISAAYGPAVTPARTATPLVRGYEGSEEVVAQWQDALHRYDLIRSAYGPTFRLVGTEKKLHALAQAAILEATRIDDREAPQREAARLAREEEAAASVLDKARRANKPKFRH